MWHTSYYEVGMSGLEHGNASDFFFFNMSMIGSWMCTARSSSVNSFIYVQSTTIFLSPDSGE
jgi:hypothetical protein